MADQNQLVTFQLGEELYGINIMDVKEIVRVQAIRAIPKKLTRPFHGYLSQCL